MAAKRRHWKEKDGRFWARIAIPAALRPYFNNKTQLTEPLGGDLRTADRNHHAAVARLQAQLVEARLKHEGGHQQPVHAKAPRRLLTAPDKEVLAFAHYQRTLEEIELKRSSMPTQAEIDAEFDKALAPLEKPYEDLGYAEMFNRNADFEITAGARHFDRNLRVRRLAALRAAIPSGETRLVDAAVQDYVSANAIDVSKGSRDWHDLAVILMRAEAEALERSMEFDAGIMGGAIKDPLIRPPTEPATKATPVSLRSLFEDYVTSRQAVGSHLDGGKAWRRAIECLIKFLGHDDARRIRKRDLLDWRDALLAQGLSAKTVADKYLTALRAVLRWAFENDRLSTNEMETVKQDVPRKVLSREKGYTNEEALAVINTSLRHQPTHRHNPSNRESAHITAAKRWVPLLCSFTGARVSEITQLRKEDLREEGGRWIIRITPDAGTVKTGQFRDVPLHRQVVELGFVDFVKASKAGPLFHAAKTHDKYLSGARVTAARLTEWLHDLALVPVGVAPNHGWRHRFKTMGRELGMSDRVLDAIQGHSGKTASDNYGDVTIAAKLKTIDALAEFPFEPGATPPPACGMAQEKPE